MRRWLIFDADAHAGGTESQLRGWRRPSWWSSKSAGAHSDPLDSIVVHVPGVYVIYSKISFGSSGGRDVDSRPVLHLHKIVAKDGKSGKSVICFRVHYFMANVYAPISTIVSGVL